MSSVRDRENSVGTEPESHLFGASGLAQVESTGSCWVVCWTTSRSVGSSNATTRVRASIMTSSGPACGVLPSTLSSDAPTISSWCMGMRTFTEIQDDRLLADVPGARIEAFVDELDQAVAANGTVQVYYENKNAGLAAG